MSAIFNVFLERMVPMYTLVRVEAEDREDAIGQATDAAEEFSHVAEPEEG